MVNDFVVDLTTYQHMIKAYACCAIHCLEKIRWALFVCLVLNQNQNTVASVLHDCHTPPVHRYPASGKDKFSGPGCDILWLCL